MYARPLAVSREMRHAIAVGTAVADVTEQEQAALVEQVSTAREKASKAFKAAVAKAEEDERTALAAGDSAAEAAAAQAREAVLEEARKAHDGVLARAGSDHEHDGRRRRHFKLADPGYSGRSPGYIRA